MNRVTLEVDGMACQGCVATVTKRLRDVEGVKNVAVTLVPNHAVVDYDENRISVDKMIDSLNKAGYPAKTA